MSIVPIAPSATIGSPERTSSAQLVIEPRL
jgi:hypothetical protein